MRGEEEKQGDGKPEKRRERQERWGQNRRGDNIDNVGGKDRNM
jgi:hypothetical protein